MVLNFNVIVVSAEQITIPNRRFLRTRIIALRKHPRDLACQTGRQTDQSLVILFKQCAVDARLRVKALHKTG